MLGLQRPRICHVPEYVSSAGQEAIELAAAAGLELDEWQQFVLTNALGERSDGKWAAQTVGLVVGRQNGKGSVLEARELCGLFLLGERLINHTAHQQKTATSHFRRLLRLIESVPEFDRRVLRAPKGKGNEAIELRGGQEIFFATRAGGGGRGLSVDLQVYDEAMYLSEQDRASLAPTAAARSLTGNIQTWYVGSAVDRQDPAQDGVPFAQVRESGMAGAAGVAFFEFSAPGDDPSRVPSEVAADPAVWAMANPGLGIRISPGWVEHERTVEMGPRSFAVERLGIGDWPDLTEDADRKIPAAAWVASRDRGSKVLDPVCLVFDVSPDSSSSAVAAGGLRQDGRWHGEVIEHHSGTDWVVEAVAALAKARRPSAVLYDQAGPGAALVPELEALRVRRLRPVGTGDLVQACGGFQGKVVNDAFRHLGQPELDVAVGGAATRPLVDAWAWSRKNSATDISPLVAVTLAVWGAESRRGRSRVVDLAEVLRQDALRSG